MSRGRKQSFVSVDAQKLNHSCPHLKNAVCMRQGRACTNKELFFESCTVFNGNSTLNFFMKPRKYFQPNIPIIEKHLQIKSATAVQEEILE